MFEIFHIWIYEMKIVLDQMFSYEVKFFFQSTGGPHFQQYLETKLMKHTDPTHDINIPNYNIEHTPTEASKGGTLLYISDK